jgi:hypothetical protein
MSSVIPKNEKVSPKIVSMGNISFRTLHVGKIKRCSSTKPEEAQDLRGQRRELSPG